MECDSGHQNLFVAQSLLPSLNLGQQIGSKTVFWPKKQGIWCSSHQMPCLQKAQYLCGFSPYLFASSTATAQATVAPTIGLLPK